MAAPRTVTLYTDYKSPYAYLAKDPAYSLENIPGVRLDILPYVLNIPDFLGSAKLDDAGHVIEEQRSAHQWRRVKEDAPADCPPWPPFYKNHDPP